ncbi:MAG: phosphatidylserine/phosphatidylglycerophosphate/cardiolipin synthase family protein [Candidatus Sericytochromatia bacterium]|nr:phosphatidylserine/phosphatidylglycerophosphate/cardiolipin synthase family protein [Candidatus Sericytochromatia bacterium]
MSLARRFVPLRDRQADWAMRCAMVRDAEQFLYLSTFYLEQDEYGAEMLDLLAAAQARGVRVALVIDSFGQRLGGTLMSTAQREALGRTLDKLVRDGARVTHYAPPRWMQRRVGGGQHVKIQVSDAGCLILTSGNITRTSFAHWREYAVAVEGAVVPEVMASWEAIGGTLDPRDRAHLAALAREAPGDIDMAYGFCNPNLHQGSTGPWLWTGTNALTDRMVEMVDAARHELLVSSFYFKPAPVLEAAVLKAARRGVHVEIHHSHRESLEATDLAWVAAAVRYPQLLEAGVHVHEHPAGEHSKICVVDRQWAAFGSYNFEEPAHDRLAEAMLLSRDPRAVSPALAVFEELRGMPDRLEVTPEVMGAWSRELAGRIRRWGRFRWWL